MTTNQYQEQSYAPHPVAPAQRFDGRNPIRPGFYWYEDERGELACIKVAYFLTEDGVVLRGHVPRHWGSHRVNDPTYWSGKWLGEALPPDARL
jgi:hypothetical protein